MSLRNSDSEWAYNKPYSVLLDSKDGGNNVSAAAGVGDSRVRLGVIPVRIGTKDEKRKFGTYALMDSG